MNNYRESTSYRAYETIITEFITKRCIIYIPKKTTESTDPNKLISDCIESDLFSSGFEATIENNWEEVDLVEEITCDEDLLNSIFANIIDVLDEDSKSDRFFCQKTKIVSSPYLPNL